MEDRGKDTLEAVFQEKFVQGIKPLIINFYCQYSAYNGDKIDTLDNLLFSHVRRIGVLGLGKVDPSLFLKAFELGAHGILVTACKDDTCHFCKEREWVERRMNYTAHLLSGLGMDTRRFKTHFISSQTGKEILEIAFKMVEELKDLPLL